MSHNEQILAGLKRAFAEERLHHALAENKAIFDHATSGIVLLRERRIVRANRRLHDTLGWAPWELAGQSTAGWYTDQAEFEATGEATYPALARGETVQRELMLRRRDGSQFRARLTGRAIDPQDLAQGTVLVIEDVTLEHETQQALRQAKENAEAAAQATQAGVTAKITIRYQAGIEPDMRVTHDGMTYNIKAVLPDPTSPWMRRFIGWGCPRSVRMS